MSWVCAESQRHRAFPVLRAMPGAPDEIGAVVPHGG
jgi:hypothetical protein